MTNRNGIRTGFSQTFWRVTFSLKLEMLKDLFLSVSMNSIHNSNSSS